jgi:hypothetical protein
MFEIVRALNQMVRASLKKLKLSTRNVIVIPTGDGMCIGLTLTTPYDIHIQLAVLLREEVAEHSSLCAVKGQEFNVRIAVHEHDDLVFKDYNGRKNIAGLGINTTARLMDAASNGGIVVSTAVYESSYSRKAYKTRFSKVTTTDKHNVERVCYLLDASASESTMPQVEVSRWQIGKPFTWNELLALRNGNSVFHKKFGIGKVLLMHRQSLVFNKVTIEVAYNDRIRLHDIGRVNDMLCHVVRVRK